MSDLSRVEQLLRNALGEDIYEVTPQSRVEELLAQLNELIEGISASVDPEELTPIITAWLAENIHDGAVVDTSLSVAGAAAESKKTGEEISQLKEAFFDQSISTNIFTPISTRIYSESGASGTCTISEDKTINFNNVAERNSVWIFAQGDEPITLEAGDYTLCLDPDLFIRGKTGIYFQAKTTGSYTAIVSATSDRTHFTIDSDITGFFRVEYYYSSISSHTTTWSGHIWINKGDAQEYAPVGAVIFSPKPFVDQTALSEGLSNITPYIEKTINTGQFESYYVNNGIWAKNNASTSAIIPMQDGAIYSVETFGAHNRFRIYVSNTIEENTRPVEVYRSEPIDTVVGSKYTYTNTDGYKYLLCFMNYSTAYSITSFTVNEIIGNTLDEFSVNGVRVYTASEVDEQIDNVTTYTSAKDLELMTGIVAQTGVIQHGTAEDAMGRIARFKVEPNKYYRISAKADILNRFIIFGSSNPVNGYTELYRVQVGTVSSSESYTIQNTTYNYFAVFLYYGNDGSSFSCEFSAYESDVSPLEQFAVNGVKVYTTEQTDEFLSANEQKYYLRSENIKLPSSGMESAPTNLCLAAVKSISVQGNIPDVEGYLYFDDITKKFYYSSGTPYNPVFVFDWNLSLANQEHPNRWQATITADGDVIFLKYHTERNPIVYPHGDYAHPYIVDFGSSRKPYGWLVNSSVVQFADGSFVFGDYAAHSLTDEQNDDRRIIWKVTKPYSSVSNWMQKHSFKHVFYDSLQSDEPDNEIGHIHAIMFDHYDGYLYCTTGDIDRHCRMWISTDLGDTWAAVPNAVGTTEDTTLSGAGQKWRMTNGIFTADAMWWATDAMRPYHKLWRCTRDANGHIDFSTLEEVVDIEIFGLTSSESQRTYITALCRNPDGLLLIDRGEPRADKLNFTFYDFETGKLHIVSEYARSTNSVGDLEPSNRIGLPMQCTTPYMPQCIDGIVTGGGQIVRPNNTSLFNNSTSAYVGAVKLVLT